MREGEREGERGRGRERETEGERDRAAVRCPERSCSCAVGACAAPRPCRVWVAMCTHRDPFFTADSIIRAPPFNPTPTPTPTPTPPQPQPNPTNPIPNPTPPHPQTNPTPNPKPQTHPQEDGAIAKGSLRETLLLSIPSFFDLVATVLMNIGLLSVTASVYQMMRGAEMLFAAVFAVAFLHRALNRFHLYGILCCVVGGWCGAGSVWGWSSVGGGLGVRGGLGRGALWAWFGNRAEQESCGCFACAVACAWYP